LADDVEVAELLFVLEFVLEFVLLFWLELFTGVGNGGCGWTGDGGGGGGGVGFLHWGATLAHAIAQDNRITEISFIFLLQRINWPVLFLSGPVSISGYYLPAAAAMVKGLTSAFDVYVSVILTWPRHRGASVANCNRRRFHFEPTKRHAIVGNISRLSTAMSLPMPFGGLGGIEAASDNPTCNFIYS
jgi:hypothetical protein